MATVDAISRNVNAGSDYSPPTSNGQNAYDLQRQQIAAKNEEARKQQQDALRRRMAAQGIQGSGIEEKSVRNTDVAAQQANAAEQGQVDISQLQSAEAENEAAKARAEQEKLQGESLAAQEAMQGTQIASTEKLAGQQIGAQEQMQGAQIAATQAITSMNIASNEKMAADSNAIAQQGLTLQQAAQQGYTGADGKHVMGSLELQAQGLTLQQAQTEGYTDPTTGQHVPGTNELTAMGQANQYNIAQLGANEQTLLQNMVNTQQTGMAYLENTLKQQNDLITATAKSYYDMGAAKQQLPADQLAQLQATNPIAYQSYQDGLAGRSLAEWQNNVTNATNYQNALLLDASKVLGTPGGQDAITKIFNETTGTGIAGTTGTTAPTGSNEPQPATQNTGNFNPSDLSKYDLSTGQVYTDKVDFNNPAYTNGDNFIVTKPTTTSAYNNNDPMGSVSIQPGVYKVQIVDGSRQKWDSTNYGNIKQPTKVTKLVNQDDPSISYDVNSIDVGNTSAGANDWWSNPANPLSSKFWNFWGSL